MNGCNSRKHNNKRYALVPFTVQYIKTEIQRTRRLCRLDQIFEMRPFQKTATQAEKRHACRCHTYIFGGFFCVCMCYCFYVPSVQCPTINSEVRLAHSKERETLSPHASFEPQRSNPSSPQHTTPHNQTTFDLLTVNACIDISTSRKQQHERESSSHTATAASGMATNLQGQTDLPLH